MSKLVSCEVINSFSGKYSFLSNFYACPVWFEGWTYFSVEHAYQSAKTLDKDSRLVISNILNPGGAKKAGRLLVLRPDWDDIKLDVMYGLLQYKFKNYQLADMLLRTWDSRLEEGNHHGDGFWGTVDGVGENNLGRLLMIIRSELQPGGSYGRA